VKNLILVALSLLTLPAAAASEVAKQTNIETVMNVTFTCARVNDYTYAQPEEFLSNAGAEYRAMFNTDPLEAKLTESVLAACIVRYASLRSHFSELMPILATSQNVGSAAEAIIDMEIKK